MTVQTFNPTDLSQSAANWAVAQRMVGPFAPHAQVVPNMTVALDPGYLLSGTTLTEVNAQSTPALTPPASGFRIDRVVIDRTTGAVSVIAGTPNSLTPPALTPGKLPVARVFLESTTTAITNESLVDERALFDMVPTSPVFCRATLGGTDQTGLTSNQTIKVNLNTTEFNAGNGFDTTNKWFKPTMAGYYQVQMGSWFTGTTVGTNVVIIAKNGTSVAEQGAYHASTTQRSCPSVATIVYLNGSSDYLEAYVRAQSDGSLYGDPKYTWFTATRIG